MLQVDAEHIFYEFYVIVKIDLGFFLLFPLLGFLVGCVAVHNRDITLDSKD